MQEPRRNSVFPSFRNMFFPPVPQCSPPDSDPDRGCTAAARVAVPTLSAAIFLTIGYVLKLDPKIYIAAAVVTPVLAYLLVSGVEFAGRTISNVRQQRKEQRSSNEPHERSALNINSN